MKIIDFHTHCFPDSIAQNAINHLAQKADVKPFYDGTLSALKASMKKAKITKSVVLNIATNPSQNIKVNNFAIEISKNEIISFGSIHPGYNDYKTELLRLKNSGICGIKLHPEYQDFYINDEKMLPIYEFAIHIGLAIVFHTGEDEGFKAPFHSTPKMIKSILDIFKNGKIVLAHMGSYNMWDEVSQNLVGENVYFDTSYTFHRLTKNDIIKFIDNHGYDKILFATDAPWASQEEYVRYMHSLNIDDKKLKAILYENAKKILK